MNSRAVSAFVFLLVAMGSAPVSAQCQLQEVASSDGMNGDEFGHAVAASGNRLVVSAIQDDEGGSDRGAVFVFEDQGSGFVEVAKLTPSTSNNFDRFGGEVAIDGDRIFVSAIFDDTLAFDSGAVYEFTFDGVSWSQTEKITPSDGAFGDFFGTGVAVEGTRLVIGACQETQFNVFGTGTGYAYVYEEIGGVWVEEQKLVSPVGVAGDLFGESVDLDGDRILVGGGGRNDNGTNSGAAYVWDLVGTTWVESAMVTASDGETNAFLGISCALVGDRAVVGAPFHDRQAVNAGAIYVFDFDGVSWTESQVLVSPTQVANDELALDLDLSDDGAMIVAGGHSSTGASPGHVYVFEVDTSGTWSESAEFLSTGAVPGDGFGHSTAILGDHLFVGAIGDAGAGTAFDFLYSPADFASRSGGTNPDSLTVSGAPVLGQVQQVDLDLAGTTGHSLGFLVGFASGLTLPLAGGQTLLVNVADPAGELLAQPAQPGPVASWSLSVPNDATLCGFSLSLQGAHIGAVTPFALSNAIDQVVGT